MKVLNKHVIRQYLVVLTESTSASVDSNAPLLVVANNGNSRVTRYGPFTRQLSPKFIAVEKDEAVVVRMDEFCVTGAFPLQE